MSHSPISCGLSIAVATVMCGAACTTGEDLPSQQVKGDAFVFQPDAGDGKDAEPAETGVADSGATADAAPADAGFEDAAQMDAGTPDSGEPDSGAPDATAPDAGGPNDAGPSTCTVSPNSCTNSEVCLGEACSCVQALSGAHYLRSDGTVVHHSASAVVITISGGTPLDGITEIYSGHWHGCGLRNDGSVWCWPTSSLGNSSGQLGNGSISGSVANLHVATQVMMSGGGVPVPLANATHISGGSSRDYIASNTCAVRSDSSLWCWGNDNNTGGGGGGSLFNDGITGHRPLAVPILADAANPLTGVQAVTIGTRHACAIRNAATNGEAWCWGAGIGGALGQGDENERVYPVQVTLPGPVDQIGAGADATCARVGDAVYCWGSNNSGQVGIGDHTDPLNYDGCINYCKLTPKQVVDQNGTALTTVIDLNMGYLGACTVLSDFSMWCWGQSNATTQSDWAIAATLGGNPVVNTALHSTSGASGYALDMRYITRDNQLFRSTQTLTPLCP